MSLCVAKMVAQFMMTAGFDVLPVSGPLPSMVLELAADRRVGVLTSGSGLPLRA